MANWQKGRTFEEMYGEEESRRLKEKITGGQWRKGKTYEELYGTERSQEIKKKLARSSTGRKHPEHKQVVQRPEIRAAISAALTGRHRTDIEKEHISQGHIAKTGGISRPYAFKIARRHYPSICNICGSKDNLETHHKDGDPHNNKIENLELLCTNCHQAFHFCKRMSKKQFRLFLKRMGLA